MNARAPRHLIEADIGQNNVRFRSPPLQQVSLAGAPAAADFKNVGKISLQQELDVGVDGKERKVGHAETLITHALIDKLGAVDMQRAMRNANLIVLVDIR